MTAGRDRQRAFYDLACRWRERPAFQRMGLHRAAIKCVGLFGGSARGMRRVLKGEVRHAGVEAMMMRDLEIAVKETIVERACIRCGKAFRTRSRFVRRCTRCRGGDEYMLNATAF